MGHTLAPGKVLPGIIRHEQSGKACPGVLTCSQRGLVSFHRISSFQTKVWGPSELPKKKKNKSDKFTRNTLKGRAARGDAGGHAALIKAKIFIRADGEERAGACRVCREAAKLAKAGEKKTSHRLCNSRSNFESFKLPVNPCKSSDQGPEVDAAAVMFCLQKAAGPAAAKSTLVALPEVDGQPL